MSCLLPWSKAARQRALQEENEWLKRMLAREQQQRQQAQAQAQAQQHSLHEYEVKCTLLEAEVVHAAQAAHELGEQMCMFLASTEQQQHTLEASHAPWALPSGAKRPALMSASPADAGTPRIAAARDQDGSSCGAFALTPGGLHSAEPNLRMQERMARLSLHLKGMAAQWRGRLDACGTQGQLHDSAANAATFALYAGSDAACTASSPSSGTGSEAPASQHSYTLPGHDDLGSVGDGAIDSGSPCASGIAAYDSREIERALEETAAFGAVDSECSSGSRSGSISVASVAPSSIR